VCECGGRSVSVFARLSVLAFVRVHPWACACKCMCMGGMCVCACKTTVCPYGDVGRCASLRQPRVHEICEGKRFGSSLTHPGGMQERLL
jgi:hypothetical protein